MSDQELPPDPNNDESENMGATIDDLSEAVEAAQKRPRAQQRERAQPLVIDGDDVALRLEIEGSATSILLTLKKDTVIGRRDPTTRETPDLDLTPYGAYQMGVSRSHALLRLRNKHLEIIDLGSRNGTYLNGHHLDPHEPAALGANAEIRIGKLLVTVRVQPANGESEETQ